MKGRRALGYPEEEKGVIDENSAEFQRLSLIRCLPYVTGQGESHHIDPQTWQRASVAMTSLGFVSKTIPAASSLDDGVWPRSQQSSTPNSAACEITDGLSLARKIRSDVSKRSTAFIARTGRKVTLQLRCADNDVFTSEQLSSFSDQLYFVEEGSGRVGSHPLVKEINASLPPIRLFSSQLLMKLQRMQSS